ncbi:hypothetical protein J5Y04_02575 [Kitasatospora sp. RG8]|uniref:hypothetical protein n=1 Tax=Kitasatospora sp. RG8 TaxID=2820815 RepID=UPI001ADF7501|nr:hypothetical protein [Kitasatospora sp. RG8]MBP0448437.1 hypothetical protein [Kitasatospora sp. RG8]
MSHSRPLLALAAAAVATAVTLGAAGSATGSARSAAITLQAAPAEQLPTSEQLKAALLTAAELGPDFTEIPSEASASPSGGASPVAGCDALRALLNRQDTGASPQTPHQEAEFDGPGGNPMVTESLTAEDSAKLTTDFATVTDAFANCHSLTFTDGTGSAVTFRVTPITLGDRHDAPAVRLDGNLAGVVLNGYLGIERFGPTAMAYGFFQRDDDSSQLASVYYRAAVAKAEHILGSTAGSTTAPAAAV